MRNPQIHRRVRPLLTDPPSRVTRVWPEMAKLERVTDTTGSKMNQRGGSGWELQGSLY